MSHKRQLIREAIVTAITGLTTTGARVYSGNVYPKGLDNLPGLNVIAANDRRDDSVPVSGKAQQRVVTITIEARVKPPSGGHTPQDQLDDIESEVQAALMATPTLGGVAEWIEPEDSTFTLSGKLDRPSGIGLMKWDCTYWIDFS